MPSSLLLWPLLALGLTSCVDLSKLTKKQTEDTASTAAPSQAKPTTPTSELDPVFERMAPGVQQPNEEPPLLFALEVDGSYVGLLTDLPFQIDSSLAGKQATLRMADFRIFRQRGMQLRYPRYYAFEADLESDSEPQWVLSGNDHKLMLFFFQGRSDHRTVRDEVADGMVRRYGAGSSTRSIVRDRLGKHEVEGARIDATVVSYRFRQDLFSLPSQGNTWLVISQDEHTDDGRGSPEGQRALAMLRSSFELER